MIRRDRFLDYVDRFAAARVLVVGPAVAERDMHCAVTRLAPDYPMPVYRVERASVHPGAAALTAATIANLGARVTLLAPVGRAAAGTALRDALTEWPAISAPMAQAITGASRAAVQRNLAWMEARGLVREMTGQGRYRMWRASN